MGSPSPNRDRIGFPGSDTDIYGNRLRNCRDDMIEADGGGRDVRIWNNSWL